jgi:hypothetical protein
MPDSGGIYTRSDGVRTGSTVCQQAKAASVNNTAALCDVREQDMATALNNRIFADGTNTPTANLPMGGKKHTGAGSATGSGQYVEYAQWLGALQAPSGTAAVFAQAAAPTGWTKSTSADNAALRVVSGSSGGSYYSSGQSFTAAVATGTVDGHSLTSGENASHNHTAGDSGHAHAIGKGVQFNIAAGGAGVRTDLGGYDTNSSSASANITVGFSGSGNAHSHTFTSSGLNINYQDVIVCTKS